PLLLCSYTATPALSPLSLHDALPISTGCPPTPRRPRCATSSSASSWSNRCCSPCADSPTPTPRPAASARSADPCPGPSKGECPTDRKSTRLNSSHVKNSYAVSCLKKK